MEKEVCELSLLAKTPDRPPHLFSFLQSGERVSMCRAASHAAVLFTPHRRPDLDLPTALEITGITSVAFGLISHSNLSRHVAVCCDELPSKLNSLASLPAVEQVTL